MIIRCNGKTTMPCYYMYSNILGLIELFLHSDQNVTSVNLTYLEFIVKKAEKIKTL